MNREPGTYPSLVPSQEWHSREATWRAYQQLLDDLEQRWLPDVKPTSGWYGWEPLPLIDFFEGMTIAADALPAERRKFIDVGCGIGTKLKLALEMGWNPYGIDHCQPFLSACNDMFPELGGLTGHTAAGDYRLYDQFDLVYCYSLALDASVQAELNLHISRYMKKGALFFCAGGPYPEWLEHVDGQVWRV